MKKQPNEFENAYVIFTPEKRCDPKTLSRLEAINDLGKMPVYNVRETCRVFQCSALFVVKDSPFDLFKCDYNGDFECEGK